MRVHKWAHKLAHGQFGLQLQVSLNTNTLKMSDSEGESIFVTQANFNLDDGDMTSNTTVAGEAAEWLNDFDDLSVQNSVIAGPRREPDERTVEYVPDASDISDDELILSCANVENEIARRSRNRFLPPVEECEASEKSKKGMKLVKCTVVLIIPLTQFTLSWRVC